MLVLRQIFYFWCYNRSPRRLPRDIRVPGYWKGKTLVAESRRKAQM